MSALDELHVQCARRGWRLALTGNAHWQDGSVAPLNQPAMLLDGLEGGDPVCVTAAIEATRLVGVPAVVSVVQQPQARCDLLLGSA